MEIYAIGFSRTTAEELFGLLSKAGVQVRAEIRGYDGGIEVHLREIRLLGEGGSPSEGARLLWKVEEAEKSRREQRGARPARESTYSVEEIRRLHPQAYAPWSQDEDAQLRREFEEGVPLDEIARRHGRTLGAIRARLSKLGVADVAV